MIASLISPAERTPAAVAELPRVVEEAKHALAELGWQDMVWSIGLVLAATAVGLVVALVLLRVLKAWARRTPTQLDDEVLARLSGPLKLLVPLAIAYSMTPALSVPERVRAGTAHALLVVLVLACAWLALRVGRAFEHVLAHKLTGGAAGDLRARTVHTQVRALRNVVDFAIVVIAVGGALMTFESVRQFGTGLLASAGIAGLAIGFAAQRSLANVIAGVQLAVAQPVRIDDVVVVEGEWGRVEEITLTYVVVRTWDLRRIILPVSYLLEKPFQNWTRTSSQIIGAVELRVDFSVPIDALRKEFERVLEESPLWDHQQRGMQVTAADDKSVTVRAIMSAADASKAWDLRCHVREQLVTWVQRKHPGALPQVRMTQPG
jgi:small-conductance mechanosensitive channel